MLEGTELYAPMQKLLFDYAKTKGEYDSRLKAITELYREHDPDADPMQELTADLVGDYLFSDTDFIRKLSTEDRGLFQKLWDEVKYLCKVVTAGSKEAKQLEQVKKAFEEAYRESGVQKNTAQEGGVKYSLIEFKQDGRRYVEIDQDQDRFEGHTLDEYPGIAKDIIKEKFENKVVGIDNKMFVNGAGRSEYAYPSKPITDDEIYAAKMRAAPELDNLLDAGTNYRNEADGRDGHIHPDAIDGFDYYDILFKIGERFFEGRINIKNIKRGKLFKDITQIKDVTQAIMSSYGKNPKSQFLRTSSMSIISKPDSVVKNSLSDSSNDIGPVRGDIYGSDVAVERTGDIGPAADNATPNASNATANTSNATPNASLHVLGMVLGLW